LGLVRRPGSFAALASFGDELRFLLITSAARLPPIPEALEHAILADLTALKAVVPCADPTLFPQPDSPWVVKEIEPNPGGKPTHAGATSSYNGEPR